MFRLSVFLVNLLLLFFFFFFQAEDGIRDADVTGVQTCALPIFDEQPDDAAVYAYHVRRLDESRAAYGPTALRIGHVEVRSEERRVGKECRSRWSPYH